MNKYYLLLLSLFMCNQLLSQQDAQYTQFMFNKLAYNPGYAGSAEYPSLTAIHRSQWVGLEGAPTSQAFSFHTPFKNNRVGGGLSINHDKIGPTQSLFVALSYAYRIKMEKGTVALGLQGALRHYRVDWEMAKATHEGDILINNTDNSEILPNIGIGLYYETDNFYVGLSAPHIIQGDISLLKNTSFTSDITALENVHAYLMTGAIFTLNKDVKFKPALLVKYVKNAPFDMDINGSFLFLDKLWLGATYRMGGSNKLGFGESVDLIAQFQVTPAFKLGLSYDITLSELKDYNNGSYELILQYYIQGKRARFTNPRFF